MLGLDFRFRFTYRSFATAFALLAFACSSDAGSIERSRAEADSADDDDDGRDDDEGSSDMNTEDAGRDAGRRDAGSKVRADAGKPEASGAVTAVDAGATVASTAWCEAFAVLQDACKTCHGVDPAAGAPMSLASHEDLLADAPVTKGKKVYEVVRTRIHDAKKPMPPNGQLSSEKLAAIDAWLEGGPQAGPDPSCSGSMGAAPGGPKPEAKWPPEGCTDIYKIVAGNGAQKASVPAGQEMHPKFTVDAPWGDKEVQAIAFRNITDNPKLLHHWILYDGAGTFLTGWAPGQDAAELGTLPPEVGMYMPKGKGALLLDMHYNNLQGSSTESDASGVEICVTDKLREHSSTVFMGFMGIPLIPPGTEMDTVGTCQVSITQPVFLMSESPHAHTLATHMKFEVIRGSERFVLRDAPFAFDAQVARPLPKLFELKSGDQVITTCHYKNDTDQFVTFGENTGDEMCFNFASYYPMGALSCGADALGGLGGLLGF